MFILDPINSVTSVQFYKKVAGQSGGRTLGYLAYVAVVFSVLATIAFKVRVGPTIDGTFAWLEKSVPALEFANGKMTTTAPAVTLTHPSIPEFSLHIDTTRVEPVTPKLMEEMKVKAYLSQNAMYLIDPQGNLKVSDFSKAKNDQSMKIDAKVFKQANSLISKIVLPIAFLLSLTFFLLWKGLCTLFFSVVALALAAAIQSTLTYGSLMSIAVYAQTLIISIQAVFLFMKAPIPLGWLISLLSTSLYIWLAVKANAGEAPAEA